MKVQVVIIILSLFMIVLGINMIRNSEREDNLRDVIDSTAIYRQEVADLNVELTKALALQQCYHEELIRVVLKHQEHNQTDTMFWWSEDSTWIEVIPIYTIPCNGRRVITK